MPPHVKFDAHNAYLTGASARHRHCGSSNSWVHYCHLMGVLNEAVKSHDSQNQIAGYHVPTHKDSESCHTIEAESPGWCLGCQIPPTSPDP